MTINEFLPHANNIIIEEITPDTFDNITDGTVLFGITVARGSKPKTERAVTWAGYMMSVHSRYRDRARDFLHLTNRGNPGIKCIASTQLDNTDGTETLYLARSLPKDDPRANQHWTSWPKVNTPTE